MKKVMYALALILATASANAASVTWGTGTSIKPDGASQAATGTLSIFVWTVTQETYDNTGIDAIWSSYGNSTIATMVSSATASKTNLGGATGGKATIENVANGSTLYGLIITAYDSDKDGTVDLYVANKAIGSVNDSGTATNPSNLAKFVNGTTGGTALVWSTSAVPEPTSGLLMLLGVAGLALRRRRA